MGGIRQLPCSLLLRGWAFDSPPFHACIAHLSDLARLQDLPDRPVWEPTRRIGSARRKLDGSNPVAMLVDDLKQIPAVDKFSTLTALEAILRRGCPRPARAVAARNLLCCSCFGLILHGADFGGKPRRGEEWVRLASNREHTQRTTTHSSAQQCTAHSSTVAFSGYFGAATPARGLVPKAANGTEPTQRGQGLLTEGRSHREIGVVSTAFIHSARYIQSVLHEPRPTIP